MDDRRQPVVLWDIDGTLLAARDSGLEHYHRALVTVAPAAPRPTIATHGKTDWQVLLELLAAAGLSAGLAPAVSAELDRQSTVFRDGARLTLLPGVAAALARTRALGCRNGLLTGNSEARSRNKLVGAGLDSDLIDWRACLFGSRSPTRPALAVAARQRFPDTALAIVGDTPEDGLAAAAAGIPFVAVATGIFDRAALTATCAVAVLDDIVAVPEVVADLLRPATGPDAVAARPPA